MIPYLRHEKVLLYLICILVYDNSASLMSQIVPTLWYVLHAQLVAGVTIWDIYLFSGESLVLLFPLFSRVFLLEPSTIKQSQGRGGGGWGGRGGVGGGGGGGG